MSIVREKKILEGNLIDFMKSVFNEREIDAVNLLTVSSRASKKQETVYLLLSKKKYSMILRIDPFPLVSKRVPITLWRF